MAASFNFGSGSGQQPTTAASGFTLGGSTAGGQTTGFTFGAPRPPGQASTTTAGFSGLATTSTTGTAATGGFNFGSAAATQAKGPSLGGFSFGTAATGQALSSTTFQLGQPASSQPTASTASTVATGLTVPQTGFGAATSVLSSGLTPASTVASTGAPAAAPATGSSFVAASSAQSTAPAASLSFGTSSTSTFSLALTSTATTVATAATSVGGSSQKAMTFRQLEETINKWSTELEEQEKAFLDQATQVNAWDRLLMDNGDKILQLNQSVEKVKLDQQKLDHELDFVHSQQRELEDLLVPLERPLDSMPPITYQQHADLEREHTYMLAENLDAQLKRMGQDLKEIIERLNSNSSTKPEQDDPVQQITKILNAHVVSLMWVDRNTANLQKRIEDISRQMDIEKREQERNFRLAYS